MGFFRHRQAPSAPAESLSERESEEVRASVETPLPELGRRHVQAGDRLVLFVARPGVEDRFDYEPSSGAFTQVMKPARSLAPEQAQAMLTEQTLPGAAVELDAGTFWEAVTQRRVELLKVFASRVASTAVGSLADVRRALGVPHSPMPLGAAVMEHERWGTTASIRWAMRGGSFTRRDLEAALGPHRDEPVWGPGAAYLVASFPDLVPGPRRVDLVVEYASPGDDGRVSELSLRWSPR